MELNNAIDRLMEYAQSNLMLDELDVVHARNKVLSVLECQSYKPSNIQEETTCLSPEQLLGDILSLAGKTENTEKLGKRIMRSVILNPGEITDIYLDIKAKNADKADQWLNEYIKFAGLDSWSISEVFKPSRSEDGLEYVATEVQADEKLMEVYTEINNLVEFALNTLMLDDLNRNFVILEILDILGLETFAETDIDYESAEQDRPDNIIYNLAGALLDNGIVSDEQIDIVIDMIMNTVTLKPSKIESTFYQMKNSGKKALDWFYGHGVKSNYIKKSLLEQNPRFKAGYIKGGLEITINKAKPEYVNSKTAMELNKVAGGYPECTICKENVGYSFNEHATLRTLPIELGGEEWFMQFSPYGYMTKHGVAVNSEHKPMAVNVVLLSKMLQFVDMFPSLFVGCNASLPGVGGSVLSHDHFQFGEEMLPLTKISAGIKMESTKYPLAAITVLDWFNNVIRIVTQSKKVLLEIFEEISTAWSSYSNAKLGIVSNDGEQHNCTSPVLTKRDDGSYCLDIILRNNITSSECPLGVFHARKAYQAIKKESVGLVESQGMFILPGRLESQIAQLKACLVNNEDVPLELGEFAEIQREIIAEEGAEFSVVEAGIAIKTAIGGICEKILMDTAVFKNIEDIATFMVEDGAFKRK